MKHVGGDISEVAVAGHVPARPPLRRRTKVLFSFLAVLLALAIVEGASRILVPFVPNTRWEMRREGLIVLGFPALVDICVPDTKLFWKLKPDLDNCLLCGRFAHAPEMCFSLSTDARGFRRMPAVNSARHRILFLGDSCTLGLGLQDDQTYPALIQSRMGDVECLNAGVLGYTAYQGRVLLEQLELDVPLDAVVINFGYNDGMYWDGIGDTRHADLIAAESARWVNRSRFVYLLQHVLPERNAPAPADARPKRPRLTNEEFVDNICAIVAWCRAHEAEPILMTWPHYAQTRRDICTVKQTALLHHPRLAGVRVVDLVPAFRACGRQDLYLDVVHVNPAGCQLVVDTLLPTLRDALGTAPKRFAKP